MKLMYFALFFSMVIVPVQSSAATCEKSFSGTWLIDSYRYKGVIPFDENELNYIKSQKIKISRSDIISGFGVCEIKKIHFLKKIGMTDKNIFKVECYNTLFEPSFEFRHGCKKLYMGWDGVIFISRRESEYEAKLLGH